MTFSTHYFYNLCRFKAHVDAHICSQSFWFVFSIMIMPINNHAGSPGVNTPAGKLQRTMKLRSCCLLYMLKLINYNAVACTLHYRWSFPKVCHPLFNWPSRKWLVPVNFSVPLKSNCRGLKVAWMRRWVSRSLQCDSSQLTALFFLQWSLLHYKWSAVSGLNVWLNICSPLCLQDCPLFFLFFFKRSLCSLTENIPFAYHG